MGTAGNESTATSAQGAAPAAHGDNDLKLLVLGALGVVYGDIGTSPIYAFREALVASSGGNVAERADILGVLSLILWSLTIIVNRNKALLAELRGQLGLPADDSDM